MTGMCISEWGSVRVGFCPGSMQDNDGYADYYNDSPATHENPDYHWASFFADDENASNYKKTIFT